jgi:threonine dehydrogenase-like Zn-dependent dehydrogenase
MRAAIYAGPRDIRFGERPDPAIVEPTDAIVRVTLTCVCGSDLWYYRGESKHLEGSIGHEFIGVVEAVGAAVSTVREGDLVIAPFAISDGTCPHCLAGMNTACVHVDFFGNGTIDGGQGERVRVPFADGTLVKVPGSGHSDMLMRSFLALSDVMGTGHHAAVCGNAKAGDTVAVVGDGAVGLCAVIAAKRLGAVRIVAMSRNPARAALARDFGATDVLAERGDDAVAAVLELTGGVGVDAALECVGTGEAMTTALAIARPGKMVGFVGVPHGVELSAGRLFGRNVGLRGGPAPVRAYMPALLDDVLAGRIDPGRVFDFEIGLEGIAEAYAAMDERRAIKSLVRVSAVG